MDQSQSSSPGPAAPAVAYLSMEIAIDPDVPTYSGGLGILAGDTLRAAADMGLPMVGVTLVHRKGYFRQELDAAGNQAEQTADWSPHKRLKAMAPRVELFIEGRLVAVRAWRYPILGSGGHEVPVYLLDTDLAGNAAKDRRLTDSLYGGDDRYRLAQEAVLGLGGVAMLRALGFNDVRTFHLNEGHCALATVALLEAEIAGDGIETRDKAEEQVREQCVFTTHTPVPAGHDQFPMELVREILGPDRAGLIAASECCLDDTLNMTYLALYMSRYVNGVAMRHSQISSGMYPDYPINSITNGVHVGTWTSPPFQDLFDRHVSGWRRLSANLRYAVGIPTPEIRQAHDEAKRQLLDEVRDRTGRSLRPDALTIGFARRATPYKRATLLFTDPDRLRRIAATAGPIQVVYGGKAHPRDTGGKEMIREVFEAAAALGEEVPVVYMPDYDMALARKLTSGVDLWLNTPLKPREASGTSGMKAALNGVPSVSVLDGWWIEGHVEGVTGWSIGDTWDRETDEAAEVESMYTKLGDVIAPLYYQNADAWAKVMRWAIALNGSFFNAGRMVHQYVQNAYRL